MRWSDLYVGLLGATLGFGALVARMEEAPWYAPAILLTLSAVALAVMFVRWTRTPKVLLVGDDAEGRMVPWHQALDDEGFGVRSCAGPNVRACPVFEGKACPYADHLVAALIYEPESYRGAAPPCGTALGIKAVTVQARSAHEPFYGHRTAFVGADAGPLEAARLVRKVVGA